MATYIRNRRVVRATPITGESNTFRTPQDIDVVLQTGFTDAGALTAEDANLPELPTIAYVRRVVEVPDRNEPTPGDRVQGYVISRVAPVAGQPAEYRTPSDVVVTLVSGWRQVRQATVADSNLPLAPTDAYVVNVNASISASTTGLTTTTDISDIFNSPNISKVLDLVTLGAPSMTVSNYPGLVASEDAIAASNSLREVCHRVTGSDGTEVLTPFLLGVLQLALTYSTVREATPKSTQVVVLATPRSDRLGYVDVRTGLYKTLDPKGYENPMRQYLRLFSATTVQALINGKLAPNEKVAMQHGVTKKFLPYSFDFLRPSYDFMTGNSALAWQLAQKVAFSRKQKSNQQEIHNTIELGSVQQI
ncbi:coat protein [Pistachio ampelovirus A]|uniref:Coat protein n=1 Tax=Pistachio ampelovirus A TaxID=2093224 RepID=A0A499PQT3_9CLOS|nr:coat protein [Pistachio ampelovirus A]AVN99306.1 coat protein [Pistachio ampelovirus A]